MRKERLFKSVDDVKNLAERLEICAEVRAFDTEAEKESWVLAHTLDDLEESFITLLRDHFPRLINGNLDSSQLYDVLHDVGEELRHVLYHITHTRFYHYLNEDKDCSDPTV